jgi:hypothetical protein
MKGCCKFSCQLAARSLTGDPKQRMLTKTQMNMQLKKGKELT